MKEEKELPAALQALKDRCDEIGDCWIWTGSDNGSGHPKVRVAGISRSARRFVWEIVNGAIPLAKMVTPSCKDRACLNPDHLVLTDKSKVSLAAVCPTMTLKKSAASARTNRAKFGKITMDIARQIRTSDKTGRDWAKELGVSVSLVSLVRQNKSWVEHSSHWAGLMA